MRWHVVSERGKGSHGTIHLENRRTVIRNLKDELKSGTLHAMLKQLGINESDLSLGSNMRNFTYPALLTPERRAGGFIVTFRDLPEAITQGEDIADAISQASDCLEEAIAGRIRLEYSIPQPSRTRKGEYPIPVAALMAAKASIYLAMKETGITKTELAKRLKCDEKEIRRLLDPQHKSKIDRIEAALEALGKQLIVGFRAA